MPRNSILFLGILLSGIYTTNTRAAENLDTKQTLLSVSIAPIAFILEQLLPNEKVFILVNAGQNPETFQAQPSHLEKLASSTLYFSLGLPIEHKIIASLKGAQKSPQIIELEATHSAHNTHPSKSTPIKHIHDHKGLHPWTSPLKMRQYSQIICTALLKIKAMGSESSLTQKCHKIDQDLEQLHKHLKNEFVTYKNSIFLVFHPAWSEFSELYQLEQIAVEYEGKEPSAKHLHEISLLAKQKGLKNFYFQPQHSVRTAQTLAKQLSLELVELDPLKYNYLENMRYVARVLTADFKKQATLKQGKTTFNKLK